MELYPIFEKNLGTIGTKFDYTFSMKVTFLGVYFNYNFDSPHLYWYNSRYGANNMNYS